MAAAISQDIISSRCSQPTLFHSKLFPAASSVVHSLCLPASSSFMRSHAIKVVATWRAEDHLKPVQCKVKPTSRKRRFRIVTDKPAAESTTKMNDYYIRLLASVMGSSKDDAKKRMEDANRSIVCYYYSDPYGFECELDEETSKKLRDLPPGVQVYRLY